jgi:hypothetical protein
MISAGRLRELLHYFEVRPVLHPAQTPAAPGVDEEGARRRPGGKENTGPLLS